MCDVMCGVEIPRLGLRKMGRDAKGKEGGRVCMMITQHKQHDNKNLIMRGEMGSVGHRLHSLYFLLSQAFVHPSSRLDLTILKETREREEREVGMVWYKTQQRP
jgi:hypothetical protein